MLTRIQRWIYYGYVMNTQQTTIKDWSDMRHAEKLESVKQSAEIYRRASGSVECTYCDGEYSATAFKNSETVVKYQGVVIA